MPTVILIPMLAVALLAVVTGCSSQTPAQSPVPEQPEPTIPAITSCDANEELSDLESIATALGYAFSPAFVPEGYSHSSSQVDKRQRANLVYRGGQNIMLIAYPVQYYRKGSPTMVQMGMIQPEDAISDVGIDTITGHVMRGRWSEETILAGPGIDPTLARWDYDRSLTLYFSCGNAEAEEVGIAIQSIPGRGGSLISEDDLVKVAKSMLRR